MTAGGTSSGSGKQDGTERKALPEVIKDRVLKSCQTVKQVKSFLTQLRSKVAATNTEEAKLAADKAGKSLLRLQGQVVGVADVEAAARLVKKALEERREQQGQVNKSLQAGSESAGSSSTGAAGATGATTEATAEAAAAAAAAASAAALPGAGSGAKQFASVPHCAAMKALDNCSFLVQTVIQKAKEFRTAIRFLRYLEATAGKANKSGRIYTKEEVRSASERVKRWFKEREKKVTLPEKRSQTSSSSSSSSSASESSSSSSSSGSDSDDDNDDNNGRPRKGKSKWWKQHKRSFANDVDDVLFGSDDEELSGEESVDEEERLGPSAAAAMRKDLLDTIPMQQARAAAAANDGYPTDWAGCPKLGTLGFNNFAARLMLRFGVGVAKKRSAAELNRMPCPPLQPHQESAVFLLHPKSPVMRLLVDHPTGSGKTRVMIAALNNYFFDPRPKVPIFPKEPVCQNFYKELLRWPNRYRDFFCCMKSKLVVPLSGGRDWRKSRDFVWRVEYLGDEQLKELCREMRETLEMKTWFYMGRMRKSKYQEFQKRCPGEALPAAPLRALRYSSAGGQHTAIRESDHLPQSALFKIGFSRRDPNVYSNKIVMMDEVHNLVRKETQYFEQLSHLRELLETCSNTVLAGFTATPILAEAQEGQELLRIIKGKSFSTGNDEGFISSFPMRPLDLFPQALPLGIPDAILTPKLQQQVVRKVTLFGESLLKFDEKRALGVALRRQRAYCNLSVHFGSLHNGKSGSKARVLGHFDLTAPKLHAIAEDVVAEESKALVLVDRRSGCEALIEFLQTLGEKRGFGVATLDDKEKFNCDSTNLRGEKYRVLVADASTASEGVSFFGVRRVFLADVPTAPSAMVQSVGRALRMYSHAKLAPEERTVTTYLYVAGFPAWLRTPLGNWCLRAQKHERVDPTATISKARSLLRALRRAGLEELDDLKQKLDDFGEQFQPKNLPDEEQKPPVATSGSGVGESSGGSASSSSSSNNTNASNNKNAAIGSSTSASSASPLPSINEDLPLSALAAKATSKGRTPTASQTATSAGGLQRSMSSLSFEDSLAGSQEEALPQKQNLEPNLCISFLDSIGLRKMAAQIRSVGQSQLFGAKQAIAPNGFGNAPFRRGRGGKRRRAPPRQPPRTQPDNGVSQRDKIRKGLEAQAKAIRRHPVVRALRALYMAQGPQVHQELNLHPATADEQTLQDLADKTRTFAPALTALRAKAIDRQVLLPLAKSETVVKAEEGGDSEEEVMTWEDQFALSSDSSGEEDAISARHRAEMPLVLPPGWRVEQALSAASKGPARVGKSGKVLAKKASVSRVFISPAGVRYRSEAQAKAAISGAKKAQRVAERLKTEYRRKFSGKLEEEGSKVEKKEESSRALKRSESDATQPPAAATREAKLELISPQKQRPEEQASNSNSNSSSNLNSNSSSNSNSNLKSSPSSKTPTSSQTSIDLEEEAAVDVEMEDEVQVVELEDLEEAGKEETKDETKDEEEEEGAAKEEDEEGGEAEQPAVKQEFASPLAKATAQAIKSEPLESPSKIGEASKEGEEGERQGDEGIFIKEEADSDDEAQISPKKEEMEDPETWLAVKMETLTPEKSRPVAVDNRLQTPPQKRRRLGEEGSEQPSAPILIV